MSKFKFVLFEEKVLISELLDELICRCLQYVAQDSTIYQLPVFRCCERRKDAVDRR